MAITEVGNITQHSIKIGYSDTFAKLHNDGDLTVDELIRYAWCASEEPYTNAVLNTDINIGNQQSAAVATLLSYIQRVSSQTDFDYKFTYVNDRLTAGKPYSFNILVYAESSSDYNAFTINSDNGTKYRLVTSIDSIQKIYAYVHEVNKRNVSYTLPSSGTIDQYYSDTYQRLRSTIDNGEIYVYPMTVYVIEDHFYISAGACFSGNNLPREGSMSNNFYSVQNSYVPQRNSWLGDMTYRCTYGVITNYEKDSYLLRWAGNDIAEFLSERNNANSINYYQYSDDIGLLIKADGTISYFTWYMFVKTENSIYNLLALMGLKCKFESGEHVSDTLIPVISNTMVTGYTFDPEAETEFSDITDVTGNNISPVPPAPPGPSGDDEDNTDPVSTTGAPFGTGLAHYYVTTVDSAVLGQISEALGSWDIGNTKKDLYRNLISCKILKPPAGIPSTPSTFEIYGVKPQYNGADISIPAVNGNPDITFGPYSISRKFNDFRDYAPYTRAEIFLPYCGWCALPSHVVGRSVSVSYFTDVIAGTVKAVVFCGENPVAEAAGVMAYDIPFAAQNVGAKIQAANTGMLAYGKAALQLSAGIGQAVATKGKQGIGSIVNGAFGVAAGYNQLSMAANENYTEISGKAGDGCALAGIDTIIIKIVRPKYGAYTTAPYVPDGFAHTVGFLSMKEAKVSAASGLILCDNVDTSGIGKATDAERAEIKRVLETGLYVNNPPE